MLQQQDIKTFDDLCENWSIWVIKYRSPSFSSPIFLIWYTDSDENHTDKLLTYKSGEIFSVKSLPLLKDVILASIDDLVGSKNLDLWLDNFNSLEVKESCTYNLVSIENEIDACKLDIPTIEGLANFIDLYNDFIEQDERNTHLQTYANNESIKEVWGYFYNFIFWPRFNDKEKFEAWERPELTVDTTELLVNLKEISKTFDDNIRL